MEPGGVEPPSRDGALGASTRVFDHFLSPVRSGIETLPHERGGTDC